MGSSSRMEDKIRFLADQYKRVAIYGTGLATERLWKFFLKLRLVENIIAVVDRDESTIIGQIYHGYTVKKLEEVIDEIDAIVVSSELYWQIIEERIQLFFKEVKREIPVISVYDFTSKTVRNNRIEDYREYAHYIEERHINKDKNFVPMSPVPYFPKDTDTKIIAWYLPQYYQMQINDQYHGKGFTEWTNSSQGIPFFVGHEQPHIPYDVGYYDLSNVDVMKRQIELAKWYGIAGFCFHYYWFSGKRIMEKPINMFLEHKELEMPFCLNWATENWTSVWDGGNYDLIFEQKLEENDDVRFMNDILPFFKDSRYIKIDGKPLFIIYTVLMFSVNEGKALLDSFRRIAKENGFPDLYILISNYREFDRDVSRYGADGLVEFPPTYMGAICPEYQIDGYVNPYFAGKIYNLPQFLVEKKHLLKRRTKNVFRSALVSFDNTARKARWGGTIFFGASPQTYKTWLHDILEENKRKRTLSENFVFVNSWNEWAEGSHLEPDVRYGYAYLEATREALYESRELDTGYIEQQVLNRRKEKDIIHFYILCMESMGDIIACEPITRFLKIEYPESFITWIVKTSYREIVGYNLYIDNIQEVSCLAEAMDLCENVKAKNMGIVVDCHYNERKCTVTGRSHINMVNPQINERTYFYYGALLENFCLTAGLKKLSSAPVFHERKDVHNPFQNERYIVIHCKSAEDCKDWQQEKWKILIQRIIEKRYKVIEIGLLPIAKIPSREYVDYTYQHDLQILAQVIKGACAFIGVDSGFAHMANCFSKKAILLLGKYKNFQHPMPYTGFFAEHQDEIILYSPEGTVKNIETDTVIKKLEDIL